MCKDNLYDFQNGCGSARSAETASLCGFPFCRRHFDPSLCTEEKHTHTRGEGNFSHSTPLLRPPTGVRNHDLSETGAHVRGWRGVGWGGNINDVLHTIGLIKAIGRCRGSNTHKKKHEKRVRERTRTWREREREKRYKAAARVYGIFFFLF